MMQQYTPTATIWIDPIFRQQAAELGIDLTTIVSAQNGEPTMLMDDPPELPADYYDVDEAVDDIDDVFQEDEEDDRIINVSAPLAAVIKVANESDFAQQTRAAINRLKDNEFTRYPLNQQQMASMFYTLNERFGLCSGIEFKKGYTYDFGDDRKLEMGDLCDFELTIPALAAEFQNQLLIGAVNRDDYLIVAPGALFHLFSFGCILLHDAADRDIAFHVMSCVHYKNRTQPCKMIDYVVYDQNFHTTSLKVKKQDCDIKINYNDDLPDDRIEKWINSNDSGLMVLHGKPGTGKTSYIRNLIYRTDNRFMFFDKSLFRHMSDSSLIDMLLRHRNSVIVLEDCEDLLTDRTGLGSCMTTILNLTDGILGDSLKFKFICTFNANIVDIDPAILRKGRMRLKYEFKDLKADKVVALGQKLGFDVPHKEMPLCEVYNYITDNGKPVEKGKMGF